MGITKLQVSSKMDEPNVIFLDRLCNQGRPFPTSRSWWVNELVSLVRIMVGTGEIGLPVSSLQRIPGILVGIPRIPQFPQAHDEPGLTPPAIQARLNFPAVIIALFLSARETVQQMIGVTQ